MSSPLAVVAHRRGTVHTADLEAVRAAVDVAADSVDIVVIGDGDNDITQQIARESVDRVWYVQETNLHTHRRTLRGLSQVVSEVEPTHIVMAHSSVGLEYAPALATEHERPLVPDVTAIVDEQTMVRDHHGGTVEATITVSEPPVVTIRPGQWASPTGHGNPTVETITPESSTQPEGEKLGTQRVDPTPAMLDTEVVVGIGRGVLTAGVTETAVAIADRLDAAVGGTRPAVEAGVIDRGAQIGSYGATPSGDVYLGLGISGSQRHRAGLRRFDTIIAVTNDQTAPILRVADHGVIGDLTAVLPELHAELTADEDPA